MNLYKQTIWVMALFLLIGCGQNGNMQETSEGPTTEWAERDTTKKDWALVLHGGAGVISKDMPDSLKKGYKNDLNEALTIGEEILEGGGSAADAVEQVINYLENNPKFNAGKGAVFTKEGNHELDAAFMIGNTRNAGAVTGVTSVKNPISLARLVMQESKHVMFAADGAEEFADEQGVERVDQDYFHTERRYKAWKRANQKDAQSSLQKEEKSPAIYFDEDKYGTVGCVALDQDGQLVAGTSTGGMTNKIYGRVGDVPIIGAGTYASDVVAVSMTGWGEKIMRAVAGHTVSTYMKYKPATLQQAGHYLLQDVLKPGEAGMIAVDQYGNMMMEMNTKGMFRGQSDSEGNREVAIWE